jgi:hypothetical protein
MEGLTAIMKPIDKTKQAACCLMAKPIYSRERSKLKLPFEWI